MITLHGFLLRLRALGRRQAVEHELDEELRFHVEMEAAKNVREGMSPEEARRAALVAFGGVERHKEAVRDARTWSWLERFGGDLRYALRGLKRSPAFTATVIVTLALGLGANATMFGVVDRLLFRPPPLLRDPAAVHRVYFRYLDHGKPFTSATTQYARFQDLQRWTTSFSHVVAFTQLPLPLGPGDAAREMSAAAVSAEFFRLFEAPPAAGRYFGPAEDRPPDGAPAAVLSWTFWQTRYGGRVDALGSRLQVGPQSYTIVGVTPRGFAGLWPESPPVVYVPLASYAAADAATQLYLKGESWWQSYHWSWLRIVVERRSGVSVAAADADLTRAFVQSYRAQRVGSPQRPPPEETKPRALAGSLFIERGPQASRVARVAVWVGGVALIVLLVACANVANLLLARAMRRRKEIAVRLALGVSRGRLLAQLLTESLLLALLGGAAGLLVAHWGGALLRAQLVAQTAAMPVLSDPRTIAFAALAALAVGVLAGLAPALLARRVHPGDELRSGGRGDSPGRARVRSALLVLQAALSVVLLVGAGLFVRSLHNARALRLGFEPDSVLIVQLDMRGTALDSAHAVALRQALLETARSIPGVSHAARTGTVPFQSEADQDLYVAGIDSVASLGVFTYNPVSPDYFATMGTRILRGRGFTATDGEAAPPVMVVSQAMARKLWPSKDALGQCVRLGADTAPCSTVVGIVENTTELDFGADPGLHYYLPSAQHHPEYGGLFVRTRGSAAPLAEAVRRRLQPLAPGNAYVTVTPFADVVGNELQSWRLGASLFVLFGLLALTLAGIGLYGVIAYNVAQRTRELGIRVALGAGVREVVSLVVGQGVRITAAGVLLGLLVAFAAARRIEPLLFGESARDPLVFGGVAAALLGVAVLAALLPARRAARVDPQEALRSE